MQTINYIIAFASAGRRPVTKEPNELSVTDNKRPDCLNVLPWPLARDVIVICTLADSYVSGCTTHATAVLLQ